MSDNLLPERLKKTREAIGISKAEASRKLGLSKIGYCRYEYGERTPSTQTLEVIAQCFNTSANYLLGLTDDPKPNHIVIDKSTSPELFALIESCQFADKDHINALIEYFKNTK